MCATEDAASGRPARPGGSAPHRVRSSEGSELARGLDLIRAGEFFAAHEVLEDVWRAADKPERDFYQGLVHVAVAWYQAGRGNEVGCERQLEKAGRRLGQYAPAHRGLDVEALLASVEAAKGRFPDLPPPVLKAP
jgi:predicted metal-dependent hydrolase